MMLFNTQDKYLRLKVQDKDKDLYNFI